jgi:peptide/nickel transport system permease protein
MNAAVNTRPRFVQVLLLLGVAWACVGLFWTPYDPDAQAFREQPRAGPSTAHWLGIDSLGRDVLSRVWVGSGRTILFGAAAAAGALAAASVLLVAERRGARPVRTLIRALVSAGLAMPVFLIGLVLLVFLPQSPWTVVLACAVGGVPFAFRQLRVMWIEQTSALHVLASRALGATRRHIAWFAIWPNIRPQAASLGKLLFALGVLEFAGLSFLGLNGDPDLAELGAMLRQNQNDMWSQPLLVLWPGLLLSGLLLVVHAAGRMPATGKR